jgi:predicted small lipoprotein YifL
MTDIEKDVKRIIMLKILKSPLLIAVIAGVCVGGLSGCGRKGDLDPPSLAISKPGADGKPKEEPVVPDRKFLLDPLL